MPIHLNSQQRREENRELSIPIGKKLKFRSKEENLSGLIKIWVNYEIVFTLLFVIQYFANQPHVFMDSFGLGDTFKFTALYKHELVTH